MPTLAVLDDVRGSVTVRKADQVDHFGGCACAACCGIGNKTDGDEAVQAEGGGVIRAEDSAPASILTTATLNPGSFVQGEIDTAGDSDWYRINLVAGQTYTFSTTLTGLRDSVLTLRDAAGTAISSNDDAAANNPSILFSEITYTATTTGVFFLDVTGFGASTGRFLLTATAPANDAIAASSTTTASLTLGAAPTAGVIDSFGDHDWYAVQLVAGQTYEFTTTSTGLGNDIDTTLTLRNAAGGLLAYNDDAGGGTFSRIRFTATATGTFYLDAGAFGNDIAGNYRVQAAIAPELAVFSNDQIATQLTNTFWGGTSRSWNVDPGGALTVNITGLTAPAQFLAREALLLWTDATGIRFNEVTTGGQILFDDTEEGAFASSTVSAGTITASRVNVSEAWLVQSGTTLRSYSFQTFVHEIGHALGLGHGGSYNAVATYAEDASYANDSWATTVQSYFDQTENSYFANQGFTRQFTLTPLVADIVATTNLYGVATTTRTGDSIYGVGNNTGRAVFDATASSAPLTLTIVDHGGQDTLDYSVYSSVQRINLNAESFSDVGGRVGNLSIARGSIIENAIGGSGNDFLTGNAAANRLTGNGGNDTLNGGSNVDTAVVAGNRIGYAITQTATGVFSLVGLDGTDTLTGIEYVQFADILLRLLPGNGVSVNFNTADPSVYQAALNGLRDFDGNALGGDGSWLRIGSADVNGDGDVDQIIVNRSIGRFATVGTAGDGLVYFADHGWAGETRVAGIYIDPLVQSGQVVAGSANDSQRRFQNDLAIENINRVLGAGDYDRDGLQEVYFALNDGTAYLHAYMHADGNIQYANYQSQQQVIDFLTANGFPPSTWATWFPSGAEAATKAASDDELGNIFADDSFGYGFGDGEGNFAAMAQDFGYLHPTLINPHGMQHNEIFA